MLEITSFSNAKCKYVKSLASKKARDENREYTVEGIKSVRDALASGKIVSALYVSFSFYEEQDFEYPKNIPLYKTVDRVFEKMCDTKAPQGILAVIKMDDSLFEPDIKKPYIYCDRLQDPGNLGTIIRTADAAGFDAVLLSKGCADAYSPKTVRASMGSFFNIRIVKDVTADVLARYREKGFTLIGGALGIDSTDYRRADMTKPSIIVVGNEANGISGEVLTMCEKVKIPIAGKAESLNVSVAAAILMYELFRQRS